MLPEQQRHFLVLAELSQLPATGEIAEKNLIGPIEISRWTEIDYVLKRGKILRAELELTLPSGHSLDGVVLYQRGSSMWLDNFPRKLWSAQVPSGHYELVFDVSRLSAFATFDRRAFTAIRKFARAAEINL